MFLSLDSNRKLNEYLEYFSVKSIFNSKYDVIFYRLATFQLSELDENLKLPPEFHKKRWCASRHSTQEPFRMISANTISAVFSVKQAKATPLVVKLLDTRPEYLRSLTVDLVVRLSTGGTPTDKTTDQNFGNYECLLKIVYFGLLSEDPSMGTGHCKYAQ